MYLRSAFLCKVVSVFVLGCALSVVVTSPRMVNAASEGTLDTSFGGGRVLTAVGTNASSASAVTVQVDGKIVAVGEVFVNDSLKIAAVRYNRDGSMDTEFGSDGSGMIAVGVGDIDVVGTGVVQQRDEKLVILGYTLPPPLLGDDADLVVMRLMPNGELDPNFGINGKTIIDLQNNSEDFASTVFIQSDDKIVLVGRTYSVNPDDPSVSTQDTAVLRLLPNGAPDPAFGQQGIVVTDVQQTFDGGFAGVLQPDNKILVAGAAINSNSDNDFLLMRYNTDGSLDSSFGNGGKVVTDLRPQQHDFAFSLGIQSDGKIVVGGSSNRSENSSDGALVRYNTDGSLDSSFAVVGRRFIDVGGDAESIRGIIIQRDDRIVVLGMSGSSEMDQQSFIARLSSNGDIDNSFGSSGGSVNLGQLAYPSGALQDDGKVVVAGTEQENNKNHFAVLRIHATFILPTTELTTAKPTPAIVAAPSSATYKTGNKKVTVRWSTVDGAASYVVKNSAGVVLCTSISTSCDVSGLRNGKLYTYSVYALNSDGVESTSGTSVRVIPGFTVKKTSFKVKKSVNLSSIVITPSKGKKTWRVTSGSCQLRGSKIVMPSKSGSCKVRLSVGKNKSYAAMSTTVRVAVTR